MPKIHARKWTDAIVYCTAAEHLDSPFFACPGSELPSEWQKLVFGGGYLKDAARQKAMFFKITVAYYKRVGALL